MYFRNALPPTFSTETKGKIPLACVGAGSTPLLSINIYDIFAEAPLWQEQCISQNYRPISKLFSLYI